MKQAEILKKVSAVERRVARLEMAAKATQPIDGVKRMLSTEEAATFLGMTVNGLRGLTHKKLISYYKPNGKSMYFDIDELVAWQTKHHFEAIPSGKEELEWIVDPKRN